MNIKDKIIFSIMFLLIAGGAYIQFSYFQAMDQMAIMEAEQIKHVDEVNKEFREDLRKLNLQFIGRGKHLRKAQEDIIANTELIHSTADSLGALIEEVAFNLSELDREVQKHFRSIEEEISDLKDDFKTERRKNSRKLSDIDQLITTLQNDLKEIENLSLIQKEKAKVKAEAEKNKQ
jgi:archaellum component FlaC